MLDYRIPQVCQIKVHGQGGVQGGVQRGLEVAVGLTRHGGPLGAGPSPVAKRLGRELARFEDGIGLVAAPQRRLAAVDLLS